MKKFAKGFPGFFPVNRAILEMAANFKKSERVEKLRKIVMGWWAVVVCCLAVFATPKEVIPVGKTVGIGLLTDGLMVVDFPEDSIAKDAGIKTGDIVDRVNGCEVDTMEEFQSAMAKADGQLLDLALLRKNKTFHVQLIAKEDGLGLTLRDSMAGIGTITYYDPESNTFAALGHGVNEPTTKLLLPIEGGTICPATVTQVEKGKSGTAGLLHGEFQRDIILGNVVQNTDHGIFGTGGSDLVNLSKMPVATPSEVSLGNATILANVDGESVKEYAVRIDKNTPMDKTSGRDMVLTITDPELLEKTGGIVQGMSGSPILQNGKLVGAVTHVFVNSPTRGYGIFLDNMLLCG